MRWIYMIYPDDARLLRLWLMGPLSKLLDVSCWGLGAWWWTLKNSHDFQYINGTDSKEKPEAEVANDPPTQPEETLETSQVDVGPWLLGWMDLKEHPQRSFLLDVGWMNCPPKTGCNFRSSNPFFRSTFCDVLGSFFGGSLILETSRCTAPSTDAKDEQALPVKASEAQTLVEHGELVEDCSWRYVLYHRQWSLVIPSYLIDPWIPWCMLS